VSRNFSGKHGEHYKKSEVSMVKPMKVVVILSPEEFRNLVEEAGLNEDIRIRMRLQLR
jgi:hypothetical protein